MNLDQVEKIADAVLYEGYMLYPYRPSAVKNQQRWNFGVLCPPAYCSLQRGAESSRMQTEVLLQGRSTAKLTVKVRFLQIIQRSIGKLRMPLTSPPMGTYPEPDSMLFDSVDFLDADGRVHRPWQEAVEREVTCDTPLRDLALGSTSLPIVFPAQTERETIRDADHKVVGIIVREWKSLNGAVDIAITALHEDLFKLTVSIHNDTAFDESPGGSREDAMLFSLVSTHTILGVEDGKFLSLLDPPAKAEALISECKNIGTWPVLAGEQDLQKVILSSPIILYDYPQIAPESAGSFFDGTEIDEILSLRIMTLTDDEKREIRQSDDRAREVLDRTENMPVEQFMKLHGVLRGLHPLNEDLQ